MEIYTEKTDLDVTCKFDMQKHFKEFNENTNQGVNIYVVGQRHCGKSTLIEKIMCRIFVNKWEIITFYPKDEEKKRQRLTLNDSWMLFKEKPINDN